jgi:hypothetical protein
MKKFAKLSLVAAVAVAGLSTSASAVALEEAIKGVDVSGYVRYRMTNKDDNTATTNDNTLNEYKIWTNVKVPVNENVKANVGFLVLGTTGDETSDTLNDSMQDSEGKNYGDSDTSVEVKVKNANFTYTVGKTSVTVGKQSLAATPVTNDAAGTGALAVSTMGNVTGIAGYFVNSQATILGSNDVDLTGSMADADKLDLKDGGHAADDIATVAAIASMGPVNAQAWYFKVEDVLDSLVFTQVDAKFGPASVMAQYAVSETVDALGNLDGSFTGVKASVDLGMAKVCAGYTTRGDLADKAPVTLEDDAAYIDAGEQTDNAEMTSGKDTMFLKASTTIGKIGLGAEYISSEQEVANASDTEVTETILRASYAMSKNFNVSTYYSMMETDVAGTATADSDQARLEVKYSF